MTPPRTFCSDNNSGVHPEVLAAILAANVGHTHGYGEDPWTEEAVAAVRRHLGADVGVYFVFNGTGANVTALSTLVGPGDAVICPAGAHIATDECGAPERFTGGKLIGVPTADGKISPLDVEPLLDVVGVEHHSQPRAISISQAVETGRVYTPAEVRALADFAHANGMRLHMDGARVSNAAASLGVPLAAFTTDAGVDVLSLGGTKNGMLLGEAVCFLDPALGERFLYTRKNSAQLASKMRFVSAQFTALYGGDLWLRLASHANAMAARLSEGAARVPGVVVTQKTEANEVFARVPAAVIPELQAIADFYVWDERAGEVRWVTSFDTTPEDVDAFLEGMRRVLA